MMLWLSLDPKKMIFKLLVRGRTAFPLSQVTFLRSCSGFLDWSLLYSMKLRLGHNIFSYRWFITKAFPLL